MSMFDFFLNIQLRNVSTVDVVHEQLIHRMTYTFRQTKATFKVLMDAHYGSIRAEMDKGHRHLHSTQGI